MTDASADKARCVSNLPDAGQQSASGIRLVDVKGLDEVKRTVQQTLNYHIKYPKVSDKLLYPYTVLLLYGPPGTGKSMLARAIAGELNLPLIHWCASSFMSRYIGDFEKNVVEAFKALPQHSDSVVWMDVCEAILSRDKFIPAFLWELDMCHSHMILLLETNQPWKINGRVLHPKLVKPVLVGLPDANARKDMIGEALMHVPLADDVDIDELVARTEGYSGSELIGGNCGVCNRAKCNALNRWIEKVESASSRRSEDEVVINRADFEAAIGRTIPVSIRDPEFVKRNLEWGSGGDCE